MLLSVVLLSELPVSSLDHLQLFLVLLRVVKVLELPVQNIQPIVCIGWQRIWVVHHLVWVHVVNAENPLTIHF